MAVGKVVEYHCNRGEHGEWKTTKVDEIVLGGQLHNAVVNRPSVQGLSAVDFS